MFGFVNLSSINACLGLSACAAVVASLFAHSVVLPGERARLDEIFGEMHREPLLCLSNSCPTSSFNSAPVGAIETNGLERGYRLNQYRRRLPPAIQIRGTIEIRAEPVSLNHCTQLLSAPPGELMDALAGVGVGGKNCYSDDPYP